MKKILLIILFFIYLSQAFAEQIPRNLYKALIAEDASGDPKTYKNIASCVRNRLNNGMTHGLVAMKRRDLGAFVKKECDYALATKKIDLESQAKKAIYEVFVLNKDYCDGATNYEHTGRYKTPRWAKDMRIVKVLYKGTEREITFWRKR